VGCVGCHGRNGVGGYPNNNVVGGMIPTLTKVAEGYSKPELEAKIMSGVKPAKADMSGPAPMIDMPEWGKVLKSDEIDALADYLISLKPNSAGSEAF
jgi:cytochrome c551/c552